VIGIAVVVIVVVVVAIMVAAISVQEIPQQVEEIPGKKGHISKSSTENRFGNLNPVEILITARKSAESKIGAAGTYSD
jgi:hypothetical protein